MPLAPLAELDTSHKHPENNTATPAITSFKVVAPPSEVASAIHAAVFAHAAVEPNAPSVPLSKATGSHTFVPTEIPTNTGAEVAGLGFLLADHTSFPPTMVAPSLPPKNHLTLHDERFSCREWMDQTRQVGGSYPPHAFHSSQPPFVPYHGSEGGMIAPTQMQRGMIDMRRAMYLDSEAYQDDIYRENAQGDLHGPYGDFYPHADSVIYSDAVLGI